METIESADVEETVSAVSSTGCSEVTKEQEEELWKLVKDSEEKLSETEKTQLFSLLLEYNSLFVASTSILAVLTASDTTSTPEVTPQ